MGNMRVTFSVNDRVEDDSPKVRSTFTLADAVGDTPVPHVRITFELAEHLEDTPIPNVRITSVLSEYVTDLLEWETIDLSELIMSTEPYPDLPGLVFPVTQKPLFSTNIQPHTSGRETRTSYWENPLWEFTLSYDYLPNPAVRDSDYKKIVGFFLARKGSFETFLFYNRDDQYVVNGYLGTGDASTAQFVFAKEWNLHLEAIGYVDTTAEYHIYVEADQAGVVASDSFTISHAALSDVSIIVTVNGTVFTPTASVTPAAGQYHQAGQVFTFHTGSYNGMPVVIHYKYEAIPGTDYSVGLPNSLIFSGAPPVGAIITGSFRYAYIVRFGDDSAEFDQFMDKLYEFDQVTLRSVPI